MVEVQTRTRKWGSSIGIILPKNIVDEIRIKPNEILTIDIRKKRKAKEFLGILKEYNKPSQEIKDEVRKGW